MLPPKKITVRVPATSANLGPGFDCLGLPLDLWNEATIYPEGERWQIEITGEGANELPQDERNAIVRAFLWLCKETDTPPPAGMRVVCHNAIPLRSGLGSSASAALLGLLAANAWLGSPLSQDELLAAAADHEGHPDNVAPALLGGLVVIAGETVRRFPLPPLRAVIVLPAFEVTTAQARAALPDRIPLTDAVFNLGRTALVVEALRIGDLSLLREVMDDRLHQPYRLPLYPGAAEAIQAARDLGAACALSGAGPSLIAFLDGDPTPVQTAMQQTFAAHGASTRTWVTQVINQGAEVSTQD